MLGVRLVESCRLQRCKIVTSIGHSLIAVVVGVRDDVRQFGYDFGQLALRRWIAQPN
jgi:hypothetical protein